MNRIRKQVRNSLVSGHQYGLCAILLVFLPKCSLCVFAIGSAISVCGLNARSTPFWEYLLIISLSLFPLIHYRKSCHQNGQMLTWLFLFSGAVLITVSLVLKDFSPLLYYIGISSMFIGQLVHYLRYDVIRRFLSPAGEK